MVALDQIAAYRNTTTFEACYTLVKTVATGFIPSIELFEFSRVSLLHGFVKYHPFH